LKGDKGTETAMALIVALLLVVAGLLAYNGVVSIPLHGPAQDLFAANDALHRLTTFPEALPLMPEAPLAIVGLAKNWSFTGGTPAALYAVNLLLHLGCGVLLFLLARKLAPGESATPAALLAGLLFVLHPAMADAVLSLAARPVLQAGFFALAATLAFVHATEGITIRPIVAAIAIGGYLVAVGSSFGALGLPLAWLALPGARRHAGLAVGAIGACLLLGALRSASGLHTPGDFPAGLAAVAAAQLQLFRQALTAATGLGLAPSLIAAVLMAVLAAAFALIGRARGGAFALVWFVVAILAAPCLIPVERLSLAQPAYLAIAGLLLVVPGFVQQLPGPTLRAGAGGVLALLALYFGVTAFQRTLEQTNPQSYWAAKAETSTEATPSRHLAEYQISLAIESTNPADIELALPAVQQWATRAPEDARAQAALGRVLASVGRTEEALAALREAVRRDPGNPEAVLACARLQEEQARTGGRGDLLLAAEFFQRAAALAPLQPSDQALHAMVLAATGDLDGAIQRLRAVTGNDDNSPFAATLKQFESARKQQETLAATAAKALNDKPESMDGIVGRAEVELAEGRVMQGFYLLDRVLNREPAHPTAWALMGYARARMNDAQGFLAEWASARAPQDTAWTQLAGRCAAGNHWDAALAYLRAATVEPAGTTIPEVRLADIALQLRNARRAVELLQAAAEAHPTDYIPLTRLAELGIAMKDTARASAWIDDAEKRGAPTEEIRALREKLRASPAAPVPGDTQPLVPLPPGTNPRVTIQ